MYRNARQPIWLWSHRDRLIFIADIDTRWIQPLRSVIDTFQSRGCGLRHVTFGGWIASYALSHSTTYILQILSSCVMHYKRLCRLHGAFQVCQAAQLHHNKSVVLNLLAWRTALIKKSEFETSSEHMLFSEHLNYSCDYMDVFDKTVLN